MQRTLAALANRREGASWGREAAEASWFEGHPQVLYDLIAATVVGATGATIDVGTGVSGLVGGVDSLLDQRPSQISLRQIGPTNAQSRLTEVSFQTTSQGLIPSLGGVPKFCVRSRKRNHFTICTLTL